MKIRKVLLISSVLIIIGVILGIVYSQYSLKGFLLWRGIKMDQVVMTQQLSNPNGSAVLYSKSSKAGILFIENSGNRYIEISHEWAEKNNSPFMMLASSYLSILEGGVPKSSFILGGYGLVQDGEKLKLQLGDHLVEPEHHFFDSDKGILYFIHVVKNADEMESYSIVVS
ncbi:hypothetical protein [Paenibacillus paeoniae]|uniref:Uncharacterized protein n=1 Tax=Paenibacillus paeoniae TaxID=2292705 RepID=A0A371PKI2_9BACL|nr:hypothetical protein [Paenibacillus paeoniae]REK76714.1 hypothetical protein DX130_06655 [Paenibacillus paeoniae]